MLQKFKTTTYATLLLIGLFVFPYAGTVSAETCYTYEELDNTDGERMERA